LRTNLVHTHFSLYQSHQRSLGRGATVKGPSAAVDRTSRRIAVGPRPMRRQSHARAARLTALCGEGRTVPTGPPSALRRRPSSLILMPGVSRRGFSRSVDVLQRFRRRSAYSVASGGISRCMHRRHMRACRVLALHVTFKCGQRRTLGSTFSYNHPSVHRARCNAFYFPLTIYTKQCYMPHASSPTCSSYMLIPRCCVMYVDCIHVQFSGIIH